MCAIAPRGAQLLDNSLIGEQRSGARRVEDGMTSFLQCPDQGK